MKLSRSCGIIRKLSYFADINTLKLIYHGIVHPYLNYGILCWGKSNLGNSDRITRLQNRAIKCIFKTNDAQIYKINKILRLEDMYSCCALVKLYLELNDTVRPYLSNRIISFQTVHDHRTRFSENESLIPPTFFKSKCKSSFIYNSISLWNSIPLDLRNSDNIDIFKCKLKIYFFDKM